MDILFTRNQELLDHLQDGFVRSLMDDVLWNESRLIAIRGSRGVGKTTLMLQYQKARYGSTAGRKSLFVRLDSTYFTQHTLLEVAERFYRQGGELLLVDEVQHYPLWSKEIKEIYDTYPALRVVFSGSSLLHILNAEADLSRRALSYDMQGLSYREYMQLYHQISLPKVSLQDILQHGTDICSEVVRKCRPMEHFGHYLRKGCYPFGIEGFAAYDVRLENTVDLLLNVELPLLRKVDIANIRKLKSLLAVIATQVPMMVDTTKLAKMTGIARTTLLAYMQYLHEAKLIRLLYADDLSVKKMQKPDKLLMENSNLIYALSLAEPNPGTVREAFFANQVGYRHQVEYSKQGDFLVNRQWLFEVGGKAKDGRQIAGKADAYIAADDTDYPAGNKIPLWLFGLLY